MVKAPPVEDAILTLAASPVGGVARAEDATVVLLRGEIDLHNAETVREVLAEECRRRPARLEVDLSAVEFVDSTALHALVAARRQAAGATAFALVNPSAPVRRALSITGLDRIFTIVRPASGPDRA